MCVSENYATMLCHVPMNYEHDTRAILNPVRERDVLQLRHVTGPFPVSPEPGQAGEVTHRYRSSRMTEPVIR